MDLQQALTHCEPVYGKPEPRKGSAVYLRVSTKERIAQMQQKLGVSQRHLVEALLLCGLDRYASLPLRPYEYHSRLTNKERGQ